jgi:hypothetical protein
VTTQPITRADARWRLGAKRIAVLAAASCVALATPGVAHAGGQPANTFAGTCQAIEGLAWWPEEPLRIAPVDMALLGDFRGGSCSGTLNGRQIDSRPASMSLQLRGPQSCGAGVTSGRFTLKLAGRTLRGRVSYRRVASRVTELLEGDAGGSAVLLARAWVGFVSDDDPTADTPVVGQLIAGPVTSDEALRACAQEGIRRMPVLIEQITTTPSISS